MRYWDSMEVFFSGDLTLKLPLRFVFLFVISQYANIQISQPTMATTIRLEELEIYQLAMEIGDEVWEIVSGVRWVHNS